MIVCCELIGKYSQGCGMYYDDEYRSTLCPHNTFFANDGHNHFKHYTESYLSPHKPS